MIIVCSYCKKEIGQKEPLSNHNLTHGICLDCMDIVQAEIAAFVKANKEKLAISRKLDA